MAGLGVVVVQMVQGGEVGENDEEAEEAVFVIIVLSGCGRTLNRLAIEDRGRVGRNRRSHFLRERARESCAKLASSHTPHRLPEIAR